MTIGSNSKSNKKKHIPSSWLLIAINARGKKIDLNGTRIGLPSEALPWNKNWIGVERVIIKARANYVIISAESWEKWHKIKFHIKTPSSNVQINFNTRIYIFTFTIKLWPLIQCSCTWTFNLDAFSCNTRISMHNAHCAQLTKHKYYNKIAYMWHHANISQHIPNSWCRWRRGLCDL